MNTEDQALAKIRNQIDDIDYQIHDLLNQRALCSIEVCKIKYQLDKSIKDFYRPEREQQMFAAISAYNKGPFSDEALLAIFQEIVRQSSKLQQDTKAKLEQEK